MLIKQHAISTLFFRQLKGNKMATDKLFTVAGTATNPDGTTKVRFANDLVSRIKILNKAGCTNINLMELPTPMTKLDALKHLQALGISDGDAGYAVSTKLSEKTKVAKRGEVRVAVSKTAKATAKTPTVAKSATAQADPA